MATAYEQAQKRQAYLRGQRKRAEAGAIAPREVTLEEREANLLASPFGGFLRGLRDVPEGGAQLIVRALEAGAPEGSPLHTAAKLERERLEDIQTEAERVYREEWRQGQDIGIDPGRIAGNILATAPLAAAVPGAAAPTLGIRAAQGAAVGGMAGALQPVDPEIEEFWTEKGLQAGTGALAGGAIPPLARAAERVISPVGSRAMQLLRQEGITPTPGQILGPRISRLEESVASAPLVGDVVRGARMRALEDFNRGAINHALRPAGLALSRRTEAGRRAIDEAWGMLNKSYDDVLDNIPNVRPDQVFAQEIDGLAQRAAGRLGDKGQRAFDNAIDDVRSLPFMKQPQGFTGKEAKRAVSGLREDADRLTRNVDEDVAQAGALVREVRDAMSDLLKRNASPEQAAQLTGLDRAYAGFIPIKEASRNAREGVFTPFQYSQQIKKADAASGRTGFARGTALNQELAEAADQIISTSDSQLKDAGCAKRRRMR